MKPRKYPERTCLGCQEKREKRQMVRVVRSPDGEISIDDTGKKPGRGAYICPNIECLNAALKGKRLQKALEVEIPEAIWEELRCKMPLTIQTQADMPTH